MDPNLGLFVFPNGKCFQEWFIWLINDKYLHKDIAFNLKFLAIQPISAITSLPVGTYRPKENEKVLCDILLNLHMLKQNQKNSTFDSEPIFDNIEKSLLQLSSDDFAQEKVDIQQRLHALQIFYLQENLLRQIKKLIVSTKHVTGIRILAALLNPMLNTHASTASFLQKIKDLSYQCQYGHGSVLPFWKPSTPQNTFFDIMKDIDVVNPIQLKTALNKLIAFERAQPPAPVITPVVAQSESKSELRV